MKNKPLFMRIGFAVTGLRNAVFHEKSIRFQLICAVTMLALMLLLQPALYWWAIVILVIAMVIAAEMFNTAIENLCDFIQPENDKKIKYIKDVAAGGVLVTSISALFVMVFLLMDLFF